MISSALRSNIMHDTRSTVTVFKADMGKTKKKKSIVAK